MTRRTDQVLHDLVAAVVALVSACLLAGEATAAGPYFVVASVGAGVLASTFFLAALGNMRGS